MINCWILLFFSVIGMPKEKYDPPDPRRMYTIMSSEEAANGKKSYWAELEISGEIISVYRVFHLAVWLKMVIDIFLFIILCLK